MAKILITGAAGFIGSHLVDRLLQEGWEVVGIDNLMETYSPQIKRHNLSSALMHDQFQLIEADIRDGGAMDEVVGHFKPDAIVHLAALAGVRPSIDRPSLYTEINVLGTTRLLDAAVSHGVGRFIFGSSSSVYGNNEKVPFSEDDPVNQPISPYAATKRSGELLCHSYHHIHRLPTICLRFFTVYGPRQRPDLAIHKFMKRIAAGQAIDMFGNGATSRDYTFVSDIVDGIVACLRYNCAFDVINLGSHTPVQLADLIRRIENVMGIEACVNHLPMQRGDVERTFADISRAGAKLGYQPATLLDDGLVEQWQWLQKMTAERV